MAPVGSIFLRKRSRILFMIEIALSFSMTEDTGMPYQKVVVLGASPKPDRFSNKAIRMLQEYGHEVIPVNPAHPVIEGLQTARTLEEITQEIDTLTLYVNPSQGIALKEQMLGLRPKRVIFNPGTESQELQEFLENHGIKIIEGCTLVMLGNNTF